MPTGIEPNIANALMSHMAAYNSSYEVVWPELGGDSPDSKFIEVNFSPNNVSQVSLGSAGYNRYIGLFQATVVWDTGHGIIAPLEIAAEVAAHFKRGTTVTSGGMTVTMGPPRVGGNYRDKASRVRIPVVIPWTTDSQNPA